jgi:hypothetical protein
MTRNVKSPPDPDGKAPPKPSGEALIAAIQASPYRDIELEPERMPMPVREVSS